MTDPILGTALAGTFDLGLGTDPNDEIYTREQFNRFITREIARVGESPSVSNSPESRVRKFLSIAAPFLPLGVVAGAAHIGFQKTLSGGRVWDVYHRFISSLEGGLPLGIFSTFHLGEIISPFATPSQYSLPFQEFQALYKNPEFAKYLSVTTGVPYGRLKSSGALERGLQWTRTGDVLGELSVLGGEKLASNIALLSTGPRRRGHILEWMARVQGAPTPHFLRAFEETTTQLRPAFIPMGSTGRGGAALAGDFINALFSSSMGRLNLLLQSPFDLDAMKGIAEKVPILGKLKLGVRPGTGTQMLLRYTAKAGIGIAGLHALGFLDYLAQGEGQGKLDYVRGPLVSGLIGAAVGLGIGLKTGKPSRGAQIGGVAGALAGLLTPFGDGPVTGLAGTYGWARIGLANVSKGLGLQEGAKRTDQFFEGITSPKTLVAMAGVGLLLGGTRDYIESLAIARSVSAVRGKVPSGASSRSVYEIGEKLIKEQKEINFINYTGQAKTATSATAAFAAKAQARFLGGMINKRTGLFQASGMGRWAAVGAAGYSVLSAGLSLLSGDIGGALIQGAAGVVAASMYVKGKGAGAMTAALAIPFLLREKDDPEYLKRIYSGEEEVEVRSGRAWEIGRTSFEGKRPRYRKHRVAMMKGENSNKAALYGSEGAYWKSSPILFPGRFLLDPYERDRLMWEEGWKFPVTSVPFEDFPILGPLLAATVGTVIKPPKLMGEEDWRRGPSRTLPGERSERSPSSSGDPILRTSFQGTVGETFYRLTELCFPGDALVTLGDGSQKRICDIEIGEEVLTDEGPRVVVDKFSHTLRREEDLREIKVQGVTKPTRVTYGHKVFGMKVQDESPQWIQAGTLEEGSYWIGSPRLLGSSTVHVFHEVISNVSTGEEGIEVFDLEVEGRHSYYVNDLLVHNSGLPGFATQALHERLTGEATPFAKAQLASGSLVAGMEPAWWSLDFGGAALMSEALRRYVPIRRSEVEYKNPLGTNLPSWLPQGGDYIHDFSSAEIFTAIQEPWARLPGRGLAALNPELKGVDPEDYSPYWRFKVLADLAPYSKEYARQEELISRLTAEGRLTAEERVQIARIKDQVRASKRGLEINEYNYSNLMTDRRRVTVTGVEGDGSFYTDSFGSAKVVLSGISTTEESIAASLMRKDSSLTATQALQGVNRKRGQYSDFLNKYIYPGAQLDLFVHKDPSLLMEAGPGREPQVQAVVSSGGLNINQELINRSLASIAHDGRVLRPTMATNWAQRAAGSFFEGLMHNMETPLESFTPLAPTAKFVHHRNALEEYERSRVYAREVSLWQHPVSHFLAPGVSTTAWWFGWRGVPTKVKQKYMVEEYFDRLNYEKWKNLESRAASEGSGQAAAEASVQGRRTLTGVNRYSPHSARLAVPIHERAYFEEFVRAPTGAERGRISEIVSPQMRELLYAQWERMAVGSSVLRIESGIGRARDHVELAKYRQREEMEAYTRDARAAQAMEGVPVPGPRWVGWENDVGIGDVKVKTVLDADMDVSSFGIWRSDIRRVLGKPEIEPIRTAFQTNNYAPPSSGNIAQGYRRQTRIRGLGSTRVSVSTLPNSRVEIRNPGYSRMDSLLRDPTIMTF